MKVAILGAGAFGAALSVALGREGPVTLWGRSAEGRTLPRLPGVELPENVSVTADFASAAGADVLLVSVPMQALHGFLQDHAAAMQGKALVACCKGIDRETGLGPSGVIARDIPDAGTAILTGPSFAADIARGLPTALTLACRDEALGLALQQRLSTPTLRLYRSSDVTGAELGGALKNVVAIAAGVVIGAGLGDSARAALMTRGYAEMARLAVALGARSDTLAGLSGLGDLVLTCTSDHSRNFRHGQAIGAGQPPAAGVTVEGVATAHAVTDLAQRMSIDMPLASMVSSLLHGRVTLAEAVRSLMSRPLKQE